MDLLNNNINKIRVSLFYDWYFNVSELRATASNTGKCVETYEKRYLGVCNTDYEIQVRKIYITFINIMQKTLSRNISGFRSSPSLAVTSLKSLTDEVQT